MIVLPFLLLGLQSPDSAPVLEAVKVCDRVQIRTMISGEPNRRIEFAAAAYAEQRAIAAQRAAVLIGPPEQAATGLAEVEARLRALDDARQIERAWRDFFDEARAGYLANCTSGKKEAP